MILDIFSARTVALDPNDMRALSQSELVQREISQLRGMQQAQPDLASQRYQNRMPYKAPERPLDERFADFKMRLAAAMIRVARD